MDKNAKIYVAGHRGLVGSSIVKKLESGGFKNIITRSSSELDLRRQDATEEFFLKERPNYVFLAAAKVGGIVANNTYRGEFIYDNLMIASNVIHSAYKAGVKKLLNLGSACVYPKFAAQPLKEEYLLTGELEPTNEPYAIAKIAAIKLCHSYNQQYGTDFISAMPTNLYGANDNYNLEISHLLPAFVRKFILAKAVADENWDFIREDLRQFPLGFGLDEKARSNDTDVIREVFKSIGISGQSVTLWGTGTPTREFLYCDDLADACIYLMQNYKAADIGEFINIGTGIDMPNKETAEIVRESVGFKGEVLWDHSKPDGTPRRRMDVSKLDSLRWHSTTSLKDGVDKVVESYNARTIRR